MKNAACDSVLVFSLDGQGFALPLENVVRVVRAVEIAPLTGAPGGVLGVINLQGKILAVINLAVRSGQVLRSIRVSDYLVIGQTARRPLALVADTVEGVLEDVTGQATEGDKILPSFKRLAGVLPRGAELILIQDLEGFLSGQEEQALTAALST